MLGKRKLRIGLGCVMVIVCLFATKRVIDRTYDVSRDRSASHSNLQNQTNVKNREFTKRSERGAPLPQPTHMPEALVRFFLPMMRIEGVGLNEALAMLLVEYQKMCATTGEVPLRIVFQVSHDRPIPNIELEARSFDQAVRLLAGLCGMVVQRVGLTYKLEEFEETDNVTRKFGISPDAVSGIADMLGKEGSDLGALLSEAGILRNSGLKIEVAEKGKVTLVGGTAREVARVHNLLAIMSNRKRMQHKIVTKLIELPAGFDPEIPELPAFSDSQYQVLMRRLAFTKGVEFTSLPSITGRSGEEATIQLMDRVSVPNPAGQGHSNSMEIGRTVTVNTSAAGLGNGLNFHYEHTGLDPRTASGVSHLADVRSEGFLADQSVRIISTERQDGSKYLTVVGATLIDVTGRPISESRDWKDSYVK